VRVAIVNDLKTAQEALRQLVLQLPGVQIAWLADDGEQAVAKAVSDRPDVILMDLVMPRMNGAEATRLIMQHAPCAILLVTSSISSNLALVYQAMGYGGLDAVDYTQNEKLLKQLQLLQQAAQPASVALDDPPLVALASSTGGPEAVAQILERLPADLPAALVLIQHMDGEFIPSFGQWLQGRTPLAVELAQAGQRPKRGRVAIAANNQHLLLRVGGCFAYSSEPADHPHIPSADIFFTSAVRGWPRGGVGVILTGMGEDGALGLLALRRAGWLTLAQDQASCVVYGMPKAAVQLQAAVDCLSLNELAPAICAAVGQRSKLQV
jgi:two-component system response regulator WspF